MGRKTKTDPTGQATNRRKSTSRFRGRLTGAERQVKQLFRAIPYTRRREAVITNAETVSVYDYEIDASGKEELDAQVEAIVALAVLQTTVGRMPMDWWWKKEVELPYRQGTLEEVRDFNKLVLALPPSARPSIVSIPAEVGLPVAVLPAAPVVYGTTVPAQAVLSSAAYQDALYGTYVDNFNTFKGMSAKTSAQVTQKINDGIAAGLSPDEIARSITERFDVARSDAKRIASTEINAAYNSASMNANDIVANATGMRSGVIHVSALIPTTRATHAERHGNAYTTTQQRTWWDKGANKINCHCSTVSVLIDNAGNVIETETQQEIKAEREYFDT